MSAESWAASSREQFYVSVSRARQRATIYTDSKEQLREEIGRSGQRLSATELSGDGKPKDTPGRGRLRQHAKLLTRQESEAQRNAANDDHKRVVIREKTANLAREERHR